MGLKMHPLFTVSAGFALMTVLPLLAGTPRLARNLSAVFCLLVSISLAVVAGFQPAYSSTAPQRLNLRYVEIEGKAHWLADPVAHLPESPRRADGNFSAIPQRIVKRDISHPLERRGMHHRKPW